MRCWQQLFHFTSCIPRPILKAVLGRKRSEEGRGENKTKQKKGNLTPKKKGNQWLSSPLSPAFLPPSIRDNFYQLLPSVMVHRAVVFFSAIMSKLGTKSVMDGEAERSCDGRAESPFGSTEEKSKQKVKQKQNIVWRNVVLMALLHAGAVYSLFLIPKAHLFTLIWAYICFLVTALGVTAGAHRLWSHRSYKAKLPLRIFLAAANSMAFQNDIFEWCRDHRVHHKYSETDADPHNAQRGFFFSHIGWLFVRKHHDVIEKGRKLDFSDLLEDPVVSFQRKYYKISVVLMCFVIPTLVPWYFWGESLWNSYFLASVLRYTISLNVAWLVNSAAHMYGNRPYDKNINPRQNTFVTFGAIGEGFHNYHHTFPFDYSASELGLKFNPTTWFIDFMFWLGLVTERKQAPKEMIQARKERTGDGTS